MAVEVIELAPTPTQTEGPYWRPGSPRRTNVREATTIGIPLKVEGRVVNIRGRMIEGVWLDFWQCNGEASYDIDGDGLRGHQWTDAEGRFSLETVFPVEYDDNLVNADGEVRMVYRTAHIHVKVKAPRRRTLTTQLYFPGEAGNSKDNGYSDECLLEMEDTPEGKIARFTFVLP